MALCALPLIVQPVQGAGDSHYGIWSLLPAVIAISTALITHRVILSLFLGIFAGSLVLSADSLTGAVIAALEEHLWGAVTDTSHLRMYLFTLAMGGLVGAMTVSGAMTGLVRLFTPLARTRRGAQVVTCVMGVIIFFDDYANTLILGSTMRPVTDRHRISREKLSFIVDATASTVASVALISTWIAAEISLIDDALTAAGLPSDGAVVFFASIPFRFYVLFMLAFTFLIAASGRDFGPMLKAEQDAMAKDSDPTSTETPSADDRNSEAQPSAASAPWFHAVLPIAVIVVVFLWLLYQTGSASLDADAEQSLANIVGNGDSYLALLYGSFAGLFTSIGLTRLRTTVSSCNLNTAVLSGCSSMIPALIILTFAWALSNVISELGAGVFVAEFVNVAGASDGFGLMLIPTLVFLFSAIIAFATGTSFGTMGIVIPIAVPLAIPGGAESASTVDPLLLASVGSVLAGAVFGDHCSPISDTTVLSSQASGCDHIAHVRTQLPYALAVALIAIVCGTLPAGMGVSAWLLVVVGIVAVAAMVRVFGRPADCEAQESENSEPVRVR
jgi:Na+/H+ antiporter NhaC